MSLGRLTEARAILQEALGRNPQRLSYRQRMYLLAFLQNDQEQLQEQMDWASHEPGAPAFLGHSDTEAYFGRLRKARELSQSAEEFSLRNDYKERAALFHAAEALREAEFGNAGAARAQALAALAAASGPDTRVLAALALAQTGDAARARKLADQLNERFPSATLIGNYWLPAIRAELEIVSSNHNKAIELLRRTEPYELSSESPMIPVYVRAKAYLSPKQGEAAAMEFEKILKHRGIAGNSFVGALALLGLAKASTVSGNISQARARYEDFLALWKDADPDIPIFREARAELVRITPSPNKR
jgi:tetratricopeptide (TPR) repeat protein